MTLTPEHRRLDYSYSSTRDYPDDLSDLSDELGESDMEVVFVACAVAALVCMLLVIVFACCAVSATCASLERRRELYSCLQIMKSKERARRSRNSRQQEYKQVPDGSNNKPGLEVGKEVP